MSFNNTLQSVANFASQNADLLPLSGVGGYANEPFLSLANDALSLLITNPNDWKFNRQTMPLMVTCLGKQDYLFAGAVAFSLGNTNQGWAIDLASNNAITVAAGVVTVNTLETHRFAVGDTIYLQGVLMTTGTSAIYNSTFTNDGSTTGWTNGWVITVITGTSFSFAATTGQNDSDAGGAPGIFNFGYGTSASMVQMTDTSSPQYCPGELLVWRELPVTSTVGNPEKVSVLADNGAGVLTIRFYRIPGQVSFGVTIVYQAQAPLKVSLGDNWSPFPDHYSGIYRQAVMTTMYRYLNDARYPLELQKLNAMIAQYHAADEGEETSVSVIPESGLMDDPYGSLFWGW